MELDDASGAEQTLTCPQCSSVLKAIRTPDRITVHACAPCRSAWLDGGAIADAGWGEGLPQPAGTQQTDRACPRCSNALIELTYETSKGETLVDYCESCSGLRVDQANLGVLRELAMSTRGAGDGSSEAAPEDPGDEPEGAKPVVMHVEPERSGSPATVIIALLAILALGGAYFFWQSGVEEQQSGWTQGKPETLMRKPVDSGGFYTAIPPLQEFFKQFGRWPNDAEELESFSQAEGFSFDLSKFDHLTWTEKDNGGLVLQWRSKGSAKEGTFHVSQPIVKSDDGG